MPDRQRGSGASMVGEQCLAISLESAASHILTSDGKEISFTKAMLTLRNICDTEVVNVLPFTSIGQEGGTVQDVSHAFSHKAVATIPPGGTVRWDVFDQLLPAHPGIASKVHMFGYRAALNWIFDLTAYAEYRHAGSSVPVQTPVSRWTFRWRVTNVITGEVGIAIDTLSAK